VRAVLMTTAARRAPRVGGTSRRSSSADRGDRRRAAHDDARRERGPGEAKEPPRTRQPKRRLLYGNLVSQTFASWRNVPRPCALASPALTLLNPASLEPRSGRRRWGAATGPRACGVDSVVQGNETNANGLQVLIETARARTRETAKREPAVHRTTSSSRQRKAPVDGIVVRVAFPSRRAMAAVSTRRDYVNANANAARALRPLEPDL